MRFILFLITVLYPFFLNAQNKNNLYYLRPRYSPLIVKQGCNVCNDQSLESCCDSSISTRVYIKDKAQLVGFCPVSNDGLYKIAPRNKDKPFYCARISSEDFEKFYRIPRSISAALQIINCLEDDRSQSFAAIFGNYGYYYSFVQNNSLKASISGILKVGIDLDFTPISAVATKLNISGANGEIGLFFEVGYLATRVPNESGFSTFIYDSFGVEIFF